MSFWGTHCYPWFGFLLTSPVGFKARVCSALFTFCRGECSVHFMRSTSGNTHAHLLVAGIAVSQFPTCIRRGLDLAQIWTGNHPDRTWTCYHCASDPSFKVQVIFSFVIWGGYSLAPVNRVYALSIGWNRCLWERPMGNIRKMSKSWVFFSNILSYFYYLPCFECLALREELGCG